MTAPLPRYIVLWVPNWELNSLVVEVPPNAAAVIVNRGKVQVATPTAQAQGVRVGMTQIMAQYCSPDLLVLPPDKERESAAFETVLQVFDDFAAGVVAVHPGLAFAPARGPAKWAGGEGALVGELIEQVALQTGAECQVGIADTLAAALQAARQNQIVAPQETKRFLDSQNLRVITQDLPPKIRDSVNLELPVLTGLGIHTVGDLRKLGASAVVSRFGASGVVLWQLIEGGQVPHSSLERATEELQVSVDLDPPALASQQALVAIRQAATALADSLAYKNLYSSTVRITLERVSGALIERTWTLLDASSSSQVGKRIMWQMRGMTDSMTSLDSSEQHALKSISVTALHPVHTPEIDPLWGGSQTLRKASRAVEEVQALLGDEVVVIPKLHGGFDPRSRLSFSVWGNESPQFPPRDAPWEGRVSTSPIVLFTRAPEALLVGKRRDGTVGRIWVNQRGELNGEPQHLMVFEEHPELPSGDHLLQEVKTVWMVRGRWWQAHDERHRPRCYMQIGRVTGPDLLLVQKRGQWWVEGIYPRENLTAR